jgi:DNA-binding LacI/PurR family transcriptional regulator
MTTPPLSPLTLLLSRHTRRREFGGTAGFPLAARAQPAGKIARIGIFAGAANPVIAAAYRAFLDELRKAGFNEDQNLLVDHRPTDQDSSSLSADAAEMIRSKVDVIVATGSEAALQAAVAASRTVPIVIVAINYDPIALCEEPGTTGRKRHRSGLTPTGTGRKASRTAYPGISQ